MAFGDELRAARRRQGWSYSRLIWALKEEARRQSVSIMNDRSLTTALSRWENNRNTPDRIYRKLLTAVLGLPDAEEIAVRTSTYERDLDRAIDALDVLSRWDDESRLFFTSPQGLVDSDRVVSGYLFAKSHFAETQTSPDSSSTAESDSISGRIRARASILMRDDFEQGGGYVLDVLIAFFQESVIPELRVDRPDNQRRAVYAAAAEVTQLLGWSAYDAGRQAVAARYFTLGLRLADEAADRPMGARLLANLSHQYNALGDFRQALTTARAAQAALRGCGATRVETMCVMMEARALAGLRDGRGAAQAVSQAERLFGRSSNEEPAWISYYDAAELSGDIAHAFRDLGREKRAREFARAALTTTTPRRTRVFIKLLDAHAALNHGEMEEATHLATGALRIGKGLKSKRYLHYLRTFTRSIPDLGHPTVAEFTQTLVRQHPEFSLRPDEALRA